MEELRLYHKTPNIERIKNDFDCGKFKINNAYHGHLDKYIYDFRGGRAFKKPGTFGFGLYAFEKYDCARQFQGTKGNVLVLQVSYEKGQLLDLWQDMDEIQQFGMFANDPKIQKAYKDILIELSKKIKQDSVQGFLLEVYIKFLKKKDGRDILMVRGQAYNDVGMGNGIYHFPNTVEYCIKNERLIKSCQSDDAEEG